MNDSAIQIFTEKILRMVYRKYVRSLKLSATTKQEGVSRINRSWQKLKERLD